MIDPSNRFLKAMGKPPSRTGRDADDRRTIPLNSSKWRKLRAHVLAQEPLCRHCHDRLLNVPATDVDHVSGDPSDNSMGNLQALCHSCHSIKTAADHGKNVIYGGDVLGQPLDPNHHWNLEKSLGADADRPRPLSAFNSKSGAKP